MNHVNFENLQNIISKLRHPEHGCPWDLAQTHKSLLKYLLEESYEFIAAVENQGPLEMEEEMGDILLQVLLHCAIAQEQGHFDFESVAKKLADKLIRRHPHVFAKKEGHLSPSIQEVTKNWQKTKGGENPNAKCIDKSYLNFPPLFTAHKIGLKTAQIGFDWEGPEQVAYKVEEEWQEVKEELLKSKKDIKKIKEEIGDLLFSTAQLARHFNLDPEDTLRQANIKFIKRFTAMEQLIQDNHKKLENLNQRQMDVYWAKAKECEKQQEKSSLQKKV